MTDTLGHRHIFGVLVPDMNTVVQPEFDRLRPDGVTNQTNRYAPAPDVVSHNIVERAKELLACNVQSLIVGVTTDAAPNGLKALAQRAADLEEAIGLPVTTGSFANFAALRVLEARKIAIVTPFSPELDANVRKGYEDQGFEVTDIQGLSCPTLQDIAQTPLPDIEDLFRRVDAQAADAIVQVGTALPVIGLIEELEQELDRPLVAVNATSYWHALRQAGLADGIEGYGTLLREH